MKLSSIFKTVSVPQDNPRRADNAFRGSAAFKAVETTVGLTRILPVIHERRFQAHSDAEWSQVWFACELAS